MATFTREEVAKHSTAKALWTVIDGDVYDLTDFADMHPGNILFLGTIPSTMCAKKVLGGPGCLCNANGYVRTEHASFLLTL